MLHRHQLAVSIPAFLVLVALAGAAQKPAGRFPGKPANPGASELNRSYSQSGSMGNGYRPYSAWNYQRNARSNAQALYGYGQTVQKLPPETAREHVIEIKKNVAAAKKEVGKLGDEAAKKAELKEHIDAMVKHYEAAEKMCAMMEESIGDSVDNEKMCDCCKVIDDELKAAEAEHQKVLDKLGIALPGPVSDSEADQPAKGAKEPNK